MDVLRGMTTSALDTASAILSRRIRAGEHDDPFRPHSTRDIDDLLERLLEQATPSGNMPLNYAYAFMLVVGERGSRLSKDPEELGSPATQAVIAALERFMALRLSPADAAQAHAPVVVVGANKVPIVRTCNDDADPSVAAARYFGVAIRMYAEWALRAAQRTPSVARRALFHLDACISNWRPGPGHLTPAHAALAEVAVKTHNAFSAVRRLEEPIFDINPHRTGVTVFDYCDYYLYGGLCYASLQRFAESAEFLEQVALAPARAPSARCIAAVKAHLLVTTIMSGEGTLPASMRLARVLVDCARDYQAFCDGVGRAIAAKTFDPATSTQAPLTADIASEGLLPLAQQALLAVPFHRARNLTRTYLTVSLAALAAECGTNEAGAEARLREMVLNRQISCTVNRETRVVKFTDAPPPLAPGAANTSAGNDATTEQEALRRVVEVNRIVAERQELAMLAPGFLLATTPDVNLALEQTRREMDAERGGMGGGLLGALVGGRR
jgi:hypothetical protein